MKKLNVFSMALLLTISLNASGATVTFDTQAQSILDRVGLTMGEDNSVTLKGRSPKSGEECTIEVINSTRISPSFPESSRASQQIEVLAQVGNEFDKFTLSRSSQTMQYENQIRVGASILNLAVKNKTGIGNGKMKQALSLSKTVGPHRTLSITVTGFSGVPLNCNVSK